nr:copia protein [Tanacetum cinerariifolium]
MVYQMDVKSAFLYGTIEEEVYVDDIIFGSTNKDLCKAFEKLMKDKFQMSSMGELTFFLGLQVKQKPDGIFISQDKHVAEILRKFVKQKPDGIFIRQDKYVAEILRKFGLTDRKSASTPIDTEKTLLKDPDALRLDDAESIDCLPNKEIFTELSRMGAQVGDLSSHTTKYSSPALTQKVFANMRRVGKGFFEVETPLFEGMIVAQQADDVANEGATGVDVDVVPTAAAEPSIPSPTPTTQSPSPS